MQHNFVFQLTFYPFQDEIDSYLKQIFYPFRDAPDTDVFLFAYSNQCADSCSSYKAWIRPDFILTIVKPGGDRITIFDFLLKPGC